jgi:hypothetical protein
MDVGIRFSCGGFCVVLAPFVMPSKKSSKVVVPPPAPKKYPKYMQNWLKHLQTISGYVKSHERATVARFCSATRQEAEYPSFSEHNAALRPPPKPRKPRKAVAADDDDEEEEAAAASAAEEDGNDGEVNPQNDDVDEDSARDDAPDIDDIESSEPRSVEPDAASNDDDAMVTDDAAPPPVETVPLPAMDNKTPSPKPASPRRTQRTQLKTKTDALYATFIREVDQAAVSTESLLRQTVRELYELAQTLIAEQAAEAEADGDVTTSRPAKRRRAS